MSPPPLTSVLHVCSVKHSYQTLCSLLLSLIGSPHPPPLPLSLTESEVDIMWFTSCVGPPPGGCVLLQTLSLCRCPSPFCFIHSQRSAQRDDSSYGVKTQIAFCVHPSPWSASRLAHTHCPSPAILHTHTPPSSSSLSMRGTSTALFGCTQTLMDRRDKQLRQTSTCSICN